MPQANPYTAATILDATVDVLLRADQSTMVRPLQVLGSACPAPVAEGATGMSDYGSKDVDDMVEMAMVLLDDKAVVLVLALLDQMGCSARTLEQIDALIDDEGMVSDEASEMLNGWLRTECAACGKHGCEEHLETCRDHGVA